MADQYQIFQFLPEHELLLENIASTDVIDTDWNILRSIIKHKINENTASFLSEKLPPPPSLQSEVSLPSGGLKLPPFPDRKLHRPLNMPIPINYMNEQQANELKGQVFDQLDEFDLTPPFTIQRLCELCLRPRQHYKSVGKYLRAVEKSILVTSTWDSFPPLDVVDTDPTGRSVFSLGSTRQSAPSTPLFSPIPFLHEDARRSKSRSPPPSPLVLASVTPVQAEPAEVKALGLVDELDDPNPGHMSDHPIALTSVTTTGISDESSGASTRPFIEPLEQRFTKAEQREGRNESMALDEDKENAKS